jgi:hypothetical protein
VIGAATVRLIAIVVCVAGIAGMIVTSALDHNGAAITFGIVTAVAILCSMVATSVAADATRRIGTGPGAAAGLPSEDQGEAMAAMVEDQVRSLVKAGGDEQTVRRLVGEAVRLGRMLGRSPS